MGLFDNPPSSQPFGGSGTTGFFPATNTASSNPGANAFPSSKVGGAATTTAAPSTPSFFTPPVANTAAAGGQTLGGTGLFGSIGGASTGQALGSSPALTFGSAAATAPSTTASGAAGFNFGPSSSLGTTSGPTVGSAIGSSASSAGTPGSVPASQPAATPSSQPQGGFFPTATKPLTTQAPVTPAANKIAKAPAGTPGPLKLGDLATPSTSAATGAASGAPATKAGETATAQAELSFSTLKNRTMEEILQRWNQELDQCTKEFHRQAVEVQNWDRIILENSYSISKLCEQLNEAETLQKEIDDNLGYISSQQNSLDSALAQYDADLQRIIQNEMASMQNRHSHADEERERAYSLAESLNLQLDEMASQLSVLIGEINASKGEEIDGGLGSTGDGDSLLGDGEEPSPVGAIVRILNEHLSSLEWLDSSTADLAQRVQNLVRTSDEGLSHVDRAHRGGAATGAFDSTTPARPSITSLFGVSSTADRLAR
ncbi:uncharacterized protein SPPG_09559 [Spizellomyces punctatus DAOM BR117]|uniref:Nucleoporin NSP1-like C-terminal domain-containing protein n=1 Tax=Spizellomyces punctatus (strain DAOM BR117) TaxID=645134 RepID=A0A0L0H512_SPIPD|nr:uncharacterized protein SPPG_09559 [Spizellomyces punctatus DAOM BR117]KNC96006.1 hypothetical protein SPPG_09559 [Spizellomyces punctatus DAOM BR117]|eukprot:XP_016604046.1 hypothetical protein SPPG_09559 [Spizellomyces punctatus DAOM BR117]